MKLRIKGGLTDLTRSVQIVETNIDEVLPDDDLLQCDDDPLQPDDDPLLPGDAPLLPENDDDPPLLDHDSLLAEDDSGSSAGDPVTLLSIYEVNTVHSTSCAELHQSQMSFS